MKHTAMQKVLTLIISLFLCVAFFVVGSVSISADVLPCPPWSSDYIDASGNMYFPDWHRLKQNDDNSYFIICSNGIDLCLITFPVSFADITSTYIVTDYWANTHIYVFDGFGFTSYHGRVLSPNTVSAMTYGTFPEYIVYTNMTLYVHNGSGAVSLYPDERNYILATPEELASAQESPSWDTITTTVPPVTTTIIDSTITTTWVWDDSQVDVPDPADDDTDGWFVLSGIKAIFRRIGQIPQNIANFVKSAFSDWLNGIGMITEGISNTVSNIKDGITGLPSAIGTKLEELFVPDQITAVEDLKEIFDEKFPIVEQILTLGTSLFSFGDTDNPPQYTVTLWGTTVNIFNIEAFSSVKTLSRMIILLFVYLRFFKWLLKFFPSLLGGVGE